VKELRRFIQKNMLINMLTNKIFSTNDSNSNDFFKNELKNLFEVLGQR